MKFLKNGTKSAGVVERRILAREHTAAATPTTSATPICGDELVAREQPVVLCRVTFR